MNVKEWSSGDITIRIDYDKCTGNAECAEGCLSGVYTMQEGGPHAVNIADCISCGACVANCPNEAIDHSAF